jgi:hypothetical protein
MPRNPETKKPSSEDNPIEGDGFTVKEGNLSSHSYGPGVEFRPGESSDVVHAREQERLKQEEERRKDFTDADDAEDSLSSMLESLNPYSETFKIKSNGSFDEVERLDGLNLYMTEADTPAKLYKIAAEIEKKHPEYHFSFETDPEGKWMKYTVSKDKK